MKLNIISKLILLCLILNIVSIISLSIKSSSNKENNILNNNKKYKKKQTESTATATESPDSSKAKEKDENNDNDDKKEKTEATSTDTSSDKRPKKDQVLPKKNELRDSLFESTHVKECNTKHDPFKPVKRRDHEKDDENKPILHNGKEYYLPKNKQKHRDNRKYGFEDAAYLFDYMDPVLQADIVKSLSVLWKKSKEIKPENDVFDYYTLENQILYYKLSGNNVDNLTTKDSQYEYLTNHNPGFKKEKFEGGLTLPQLLTLSRIWGWAKLGSNSLFAKKLLDRYDFDGDGKLSAEEFINLVIKTTFQHKTRKDEELFSDVIEKIDTFFSVLDCNEDEYLSSEEMWAKLKLLKRGTENCDIYKCHMPNGHMRTASVNDFILKNENSAKGYLNINEFRSGILLGYLDRHITDNEIVEKDEKNLKAKRWGPDDLTRDIVCEEVNEMMEKMKKS